MPSVTYRKKGKRWHIRFQEKGKKEVIESHPGTLQEKTIKQRAQWWREQISLGRADPWEEKRDSVLVIEALQEFLEANYMSKNWAESTYKTNVSVLNRMLEPIADKFISQVSKDTFQELYEDLPGGPHTKRSDRGRINGFLRFCHDNDYLPRYKLNMPMSDVLEIRNSESIKYLTWDQVNDICRAHLWVSRQNKAIFRQPKGKDPQFYVDLLWFMFYSLLRKEEVPKLRVKDLSRNRLRVKGKGRRTDTIILPPPALEIARKYAKGKAPEEPLFLTHMNRVKKHLGRAVELALGKDHPKGFHQLRHSGVVHYITLGKPVQFVSKLARHRTVQVTLTVYADIIPDSMEQVFSDIEHRKA